MVDIEGLVQAYLQEALTSARVAIGIPADYDEHTQVVGVSKAAGARTNFRLSRPVVDINILAPGVAGDRTLVAPFAASVDDAMYAMPGAYPLGVVTEVSSLVDPRFLPFEDAKWCRLQGSYLITAHEV